MTSPTIDELKKRQLELEKNLVDHIASFEKRNDVQISSVHFDRRETMGDSYDRPTIGTVIVFSPRTR